MKFLQWLKPDRLRRREKVPAKADLRLTRLGLMRLEKRRLLNGDFSFVAGLDLTLDNIDADLTIQETAADFQFILNTGQWTGTDVAGSVSGNGTGSLSIDKVAFGGLSQGTSIGSSPGATNQSGNPTSLTLNSQLPVLDMSVSGGKLVINDFDSVNQIVGEAEFTDLTINNAETISFNQIVADDITLDANHIDFAGGPDSIVGSTLTVTPSTVSTIVIGGTTTAAGELNLTDTEIDALANGFSSIAIGAPGSTGTASIVVDASGASFGDALTLNALGPGASIRIDGQLDTIADNDIAAINMNSNGNGIHLSGDIISHGGTITINDALLVDGSRTVDSTNFDQTAAANIQISGIVDGFNAGATDELLIDAVRGQADGIDDGNVILNSTVQGSAGAQSLPNGQQLAGFTAFGDRIFTDDISAGRIELTGQTIQLLGSDYLSESDILLDGNVLILSTGGLNIASGGNANDNVSVTGTIDNPGSNSQLTLNAGDGTIDLQGDVGTTLALGSLSIADTATSSLQNVTVIGSLIINSDVVSLQGTDYFSDSEIFIDGNVNLSATGAATIALKSGDDQAVTVGRVAGTDDSLQIVSQGDVSLTSAHVGSGDLTIRLDVDDDGRHAGTFGEMSANQISISGSATGNEIVDLDGPITARDNIQLIDVDSLTLNHAITTNGGDVNLSVRNDFTIGSNGNITTSGGDIVLVADDDLDGDGGLIMAPTSSLHAGAGTINLTGSENIAVSVLTTTNGTSQAVQITSANGSVTGSRPDTNIFANTAGAITTIRAGSSIGMAGPNIFLNDDFQPLITDSTELNLVAAGDIVVRDISNATVFSRLEANPGTTAILRIEATGDIDLTNTVGLESIDQLALISDASVIVPQDFSAMRLLLDGSDVSSPGTITANDLVYRSQQAETLSLNVQRFDGTTRGDLTIVSAFGPNPLELVDLDENIFSIAVFADGNLDLQSNGSVILTDRIFTTGDGHIVLNVGDTTSTTADLIIHDTIETNVGAVELNAQQDIRLINNGNIDSNHGSISLTADSIAGNQGGEIFMEDGRRIQTTSGTISLNADGNITLSHLETDNATSAAVSIITHSGGVLDAGDTTPDIIANQSGAITTIKSATGVGATELSGANGLETHVANIDIVNSTSGSISINELDTIDVARVLQQQDDHIDIVATGELTVLAGGTGVLIANEIGDSGSGSIRLSSTSGNVIIDQTVQNQSANADSTIDISAAGQNSDIRINAEVTTAAGDIWLLASDGIRFTSPGDLNAGAAGDVSLISNMDSTAGDSAGEIFMADGTLIDAGAGTISLNAVAGDVGDITLGGLRTTNATTSAVLIRTTGSVIDGGDTHVDIVAAQPGALTTISADNGIGAGNTLETSVYQIDISNSASDNIEIFEDGDLVIFGIDQTGNVDILITATGTLTIHESGTGITIRDADPAAGAQQIQLHSLNGDVIVDQAITIIGGDVDAGIVFTASGTNSDVIVNASVTNEQGFVEITADDSIEFTAEGDVFSGGSAGVTVIANANDTESNSDNRILIHDGAVLDAGSGTIAIQSLGNDGGAITLGGLVTQNATSNALTIETSQAVIDGGDTHFDIVANQTGARTTIRTSTGIGSGDGLEVQLHELVATNRDGANIAAGNIELNESDNLDLIAVDNNANATATGDLVNGVLSIRAAGDVRIVDDGDATNATVQSENAIELTAQNVSVDDDILAIDDTPGIDGTIDERIEINARENFELLANRSISTDDAPLIRSVTPDVTTQDTISIIADSDGNSAIDEDGIPEEGIVYFAETSTVRTDGGVANLFADRPDVGEEATAFYDSTTIEVSELEFVEVSDESGNVYQGLLTVKIGNAGEENLIFDVDWGDGRTNEGFANEVDPDTDGKFSGRIDGNKNRFLIPTGGETYVIPHWYTDFDISSNVDNQAGRFEASDSLPVRFSVSQHSPSIEVRGRAIVNPNDTIQASPRPVPTSDDISPLARLSSTDIVDQPTDEVARFDNGITAFTVVTRSVPPGLLKKEVVEVPSVKAIDATPDPVSADDAVISNETQTTTSRDGVGSEDFFQLRRTFADGTTDIIIKRISEEEGDQLFDRDAFETFVAEENLDDGSGYEIWLITSDPGGNVPVERPVFEFEITAGKPGPASEELPDKLDDLRLVPVDKSLEQSLEQSPDQPLEQPRSKPGEGEPPEPLPDEDLGQNTESPRIKHASTTPGNTPQEPSLAVAAAALLSAPMTLLSSRFSKRARALRRIQQAASEVDSTPPAVNP